MNNDKRIILAIALYAAVVTMVLHTLDSEGHERFTSAKQPVEIYNAYEARTSMSPTNPVCNETSCTDQEIFCSQPDSNLSKDNDPVLLSNEEVNG
jgi:hypothetical protein